MFDSPFATHVCGSLQRESEWWDKRFGFLRSKALCQSSRKTKQGGAFVLQVLVHGSVTCYATRGPWGVGLSNVLMCRQLCHRYIAENHRIGICFVVAIVIC